MQDIKLNMDLIGLIMFLGILLGIFASYFIIKKSLAFKSSNLYLGTFMLIMSIVMLEGWLNYTGYIFKVLWLTNFSEPFNFIFAPLIFLFVISQFKNFAPEKQWVHFIPFGFWLIYCIFFFMKSEAFKYNSNLEVMQLDLPLITYNQQFSADPWSL